MKILKGRLRETIYAWPCESSNNPSSCKAHPSSLYPSTEHTCSPAGGMGPSSLQLVRDTTYHPEQVTYMSDRLGLHRVENPSDSEVAVSLHLYTVCLPASLPCFIPYANRVRCSLPMQRSMAATSSTRRRARRVMWLNVTSTLSWA